MNSLFSVYTVYISAISHLPQVSVHTEVAPLGREQEPTMFFLSVKAQLKCESLELEAQQEMVTRITCQ